MSVATHYDTLKITHDAPPEVVRAAYKVLAHKYHPDHNIGDAEAVQMMQMVNEAYRILSHPDKRKEHDNWIKTQEPPKEAPKLTPKEQELQKNSDATAEQAKKWSDWAAKTAATAKIMRDKANKIAEDMKTAPENKRAAYETLYAREDAVAKEEEAKAKQAAEKAKQAADIAKRNYFNKDAKPVTHYDTLKVLPDAPPDVVRAAARTLQSLYQQNAQETELAGLNAVVAILSDPQKKAEYDASIGAATKTGKKEQAPVRKETAREIQAKAIADKAEAEAKALEAHADRLMQEERAASEKAAKAAADAQAKAQAQDAAKWKAWADKTAAENAEARARALKASERAAEARFKAQQAHKEVADAKREADEKAALWSGDKKGG